MLRTVTLLINILSFMDVIPYLILHLIPRGITISNLFWHLILHHILHPTSTIPCIFITLPYSFVIFSYLSYNIAIMFQHIYSNILSFCLFFAAGMAIYNLILLTFWHSQVTCELFGRTNLITSIMQWPFEYMEDSNIFDHYLIYYNFMPSLCDAISPCRKLSSLWYCHMTLSHDCLNGLVTVTWRWLPHVATCDCPVKVSLIGWLFHICLTGYPICMWLSH